MAESKAQLRFSKREPWWLSDFGLVEEAALALASVHPGQLGPVKVADLPQLVDLCEGVPGLHPVIKPALRATRCLDPTMDPTLRRCLLSQGTVHTSRHAGGQDGRQRSL